MILVYNLSVELKIQIQMILYIRGICCAGSHIVQAPVMAMRLDVSLCLLNVLPTSNCINSNK